MAEKEVRCGPYSNICFSMADLGETPSRSIQLLETDKMNTKYVHDD